MPENTVKVDRSTRWGNPFIVGLHGNTGECVYWYLMLGKGYLCLGHGDDCAEQQIKAQNALDTEAKKGWPTLRGKNLACWCRSNKPCHADLLLCMANYQEFDPAEYFEGFGIQIPGYPKSAEPGLNK